MKQGQLCTQDYPTIVEIAHLRLASGWACIDPPALCILSVDFHDEAGQLRSAAGNGPSSAVGAKKKICETLKN